MNIKITCIKTNMSIKSKSLYLKEDLSLEVSINHLPNDDNTAADIIDKNLGIKEKSFILSMDTLSMCFSGDDLNLTSIDAYSNHKNWKNTHLDVPTSTPDSICSVEGDLTDDRYSIDEAVSYYYDDKQSILKIDIGEEKSESYYQLSSDIVIGISNFMPTSLYIRNLSIK